MDTLYSELYYDLSASDVEITVPEVPEHQFKLFSFFDVFGDNYASIGTGGFFEPGKYLLQPQERAEGSVTSGLRTSGAGKQRGIVTAPSVYGVLLIRWLVNQTNIHEIHRWQNETGAETISHGKPIAPPLTDIVGKYNASVDFATNVMSLLPYYIQPHLPKDEFKLAGIDFASNTWTKPQSVHFEAANTTAFAGIAATAQSPKFNEAVGNGWSVLSPEYMGIYDTQYAFRSFVASTVYLGNRFPYSLYPSWTNATSKDPGDSTIEIASNEALLFTFSAIPMLKESGFWSLTLYDAQYFLIQNEGNRYAIGDRSNITYPDGKPVYYGSANYPDEHSTGPFQILIQASDVKPPANWTENWLPSPAGGGAVVPQLRWYNAEEAMVKGSYVYPTVEKIAAITA